MADSTQKRVSVKIFEVDRDRLEDVKRDARRSGGRKLDYADLIGEAVRGRFEAGASMQAISQSNAPVKWDRDYEDLRVIKESGDEGSIEAVQQNLRTFRRLVDMLTGGKPKRSEAVPAAGPLDTTEEALLRRWRATSLDRQRKAMAQLAVHDELGPEVMPAAPPKTHEEKGAPSKKRA